MKIIRMTVAVMLLVGVVSAANAGASRPVTVFTDATGDAGNEIAGPLPGAAEAGFDMVEGRIRRVKKNLEFTVVHASMPPGGALPEGARFYWHFAVGDEDYLLGAKSADIGKPDPVAGTGMERLGRIDLDGHFRIEQCSSEDAAAVTLVRCEALDYLKGSFNPESASFRILVPLELIKAKPGSTITQSAAGRGSTCPICWAPHYAERSLTPQTNIDTAVMTASYKVPKK